MDLKRKIISAPFPPPPHRSFACVYLSSKHLCPLRNSIFPPFLPISIIPLIHWWRWMEFYIFQTFSISLRNTTDLKYFLRSLSFDHNVFLFSLSPSHFCAYLFIHILRSLSLLVFRLLLLWRGIQSIYLNTLKSFAEEKWPASK